MQVNNPNKYLTKISQIGIVVKDIDKAIEGMRRIFGVEPDMTGHTPPRGRYYRGKPEEFSCKMAIYQFANIDIELIEPEFGQNIWNEFLEKGQHGLHHIRFSVDDFNGTIEDMKQRGVNVSMQGESIRQIEGLRYAYFDTEEFIDFIVEIFNEYEILG
jgi:methylmalonyl-CoA/ethylmalonyl-CoA epimerase